MSTNIDDIKNFSSFTKISENRIEEYLEENPKFSQTEITRNLEISRTTFYKYIK